MAFPGPLDPAVLGQSIMSVVQTVRGSIQDSVTQVATFLGNFISSNIYAITLAFVLLAVAFCELIGYTLKWFFGEIIPWFFAKFLPWLVGLFMCGVNGIVNLPQCFLWYMLDIAGRIIYLPFRITFWFLEYLTEIELTKIEKDVWCFLEEIDQYIYKPEPDGLGTGIHIIHFPDSVILKCYTCKSKFPKPPPYETQNAFSFINRIKNIF
tara:strand:- start:512 stop:1138 length:627 start_codon:yes stop_codon:yes gene_type:complete